MAQGLSKRIKALQFAFLSPDEIRRMSGVKIITADTYDDDGYPIEMGLMDLHLGVIEPNLRCRTCGGRVNECPGHFGIIELAMPVIHVGYAKEIKRLLQSTCRACGRMLPDAPSPRAEAVADDDAPTPAVRTREAKEERSCPHCHEVQQRIVLDKPTTFRENSHKITPKEVRARLERIPDEDVRALGLNPKFGRPEWMVLTVLPVPPVQVRPSITLESGERSEDDLTHKLVDVLRINQRLRENRDMGAPQLVVEDLWELLQYHVTTYFDNQTSGIPPARHRSGRPLKTLAQRLKGKDGRFRSNLSGKRVNFSARTVISPDPLLSINEVGIPAEVARGLTVPLEVTLHNQEVAKELVKRGPTPAADADARYRCGVNYLVREDGQRIKVMEKNAEACAELVTPGSIVERQLIDGDIVLFNRQPSLHRMSMMAHFVRILPNKTFRFNLCDCPPYNADFDGDEMNLHVLQSQEARAEAKVLMKVEEHILSPRYGGPIIGMLHDHITAAFLLTYMDPKFSRAEVTYLLSKLNYPVPPPAGKDKDGTPFWSGKQLFSLTLPKDLTLEFRSNIWAGCTDPPLNCKHDAWVVIENGVLKAGTIDKKAIAFEKGAVLDAIARNDGMPRARQFLDEMSRLAITAMGLKGLSTGIDDEDVPEPALHEIQSSLDAAREKVDELVEQYRKGKLEQMPGRSIEETLEVMVRRELGQARDKAGEIAGRFLGLENPAVILAKSGARGSMLNLTQMAGAVGQQSVRGERLMRGYFNRTLPHFERGDLGSAARGFVSSSYKRGLSPTEYFFHSMGGRESLVDTAVRTSRSGYMQRRLINALEDLKVAEDRTVRNTAGTVIEFDYGEDGIDPTRSYQGAAVSLDEVVSQILGRRVRSSDERRPDGPAGTPPVTEEEMDLQAEAQLEEEGEEEETEEFGAPEEGPEFGGE
ncbi:MAG TPA: DNA-directed RNA polymerase subunit A' [Thermoplasmata archaeon]|nr:DNA-directed RNA polymerase subunit A' [Thermoplasmata archaeon]